MNPWEKISLSDYENHMRLKSVYQLPILNEIMQNQINDYNVKTLAIMGVAGGNGLEYIKNTNVQKVYGIDINQEYLNTVHERYSYLKKTLKTLCLDITKDYEQLPYAEYVIANLFLEYVGYDAFIKALHQMNAAYVSCVIQVNEEGNWVSNSPYEKCFEELNQVHHLITEDGLKQNMEKQHYQFLKQCSTPLPNGKKFIRLDFAYLSQ